ncbi:VWA domain-containing protein [Paenibacillus sp. FJAT-26967]|uniref:vWA domain-containing protein n=1 Tax=Paenibacillus sp. FJAT-26967 TaxID=1729690 RepID=UPI00083922E4|nr:vWA domain-containing protein [Paenibacillus sp. FJAT-26967]
MTGILKCIRHTKGIIGTLFVTLVAGLLAFPTGLWAANVPPEQGLDAMFVLDTSFSMNQTDKDGIASEVVKMFMDLQGTGNSRAGYVAYNDKIVSSLPLSELTSGDRNTWKSTLDGLRRRGYSDMGLGLRKAAELMESGYDASRKPFLILLSDGGTDFGKQPGGRNPDISSRDVEDSIGIAKKLGYPIYTVGLNRDGSARKDELERIAAATGGASYLAGNADDLPEIFNLIFAKQLQSALISVSAVSATGELQEVTVPIPNSSMNEANIILLSQSPVTEAQVYSTSKNVRLYKSDNYTLMKVIEPQKGSMRVIFRGKPGDLVKVNLLGNYKLQAGADSPAEAMKGAQSPFTARLYKPDGKPLEDADVYAAMKAELVVYDPAKKAEERIALKPEGNSFGLGHVFPSVGTYNWKIILTAPDFNRETASSEIKAVNAPPVAQAGTLQLSMEEGKARIDLNEYFQDANREKLTYAVSPADDDQLVSAQIVEEGFLLLNPLTTGSGSVRITAVDGEGASAISELSFTVVSVWTLIIKVLLAVLAAAVLGLVLYLAFRPRPKFTGRLEGYFLHTASGNDIPVKYWPLTSFGSRSISLQDLFTSLDVHELLPESNNIIFEAGKNGTLLFRHSTKCLVQKGTLILGKTPKETLAYNDKLYITFEDGVTEIELRYKAAKTSLQPQTQKAQTAGT